ncbi:coniferyl aldehyde dehydrogenase [Saccharospirillum impatiens]|uniref:coniferyl aldehyde dehydrogenase n=1 Tax=Saccharospirillum impatiens TaxID=169438 RepID=UPI00040A8C77|nr:coniferyl aldehyde dehydrogenase [Saccharospirillum impatiens]
MTPDMLRTQFDHQQASYRLHPYPSLAERRYRLQQLKQLILGNQDALIEALDQDFGCRSAGETLNAEVLPSILGINHTLRHLKGWMKARKHRVPLLFQPAHSKVLPQPLGVAGIIVPWNYALYLAIGPMTAALAAGNHCMVKISEYTPAFGALFQQLVDQTFDDGVITVINGDVEMAQAFSSLPFDHLLFTGSTEVGKAVMAAAAQNLTPVTLELGGKSPAVIDTSIPIEVAAERLAFGKCLNSGQTCIAPDYVLCPPDRIDAFIEAFHRSVSRMYGQVIDNPEYTSIINDRQRQRLDTWLRQAETEGAHLHWGDQRPGLDAASGKMAPVLLTNVSLDSQVMQQELFGPILPVIPCETELEAQRFINSRPRPLALYLFGYDRAWQAKFEHSTHSGALVINEALFHATLDNIPFGGVGASGMGHYHGKAGFDTFSKLKPVVGKQRLNSLKLVYPPYDGWVQRQLRRMFLK